MSRKNRNARRQHNKPMNMNAIQISMPLPETDSIRMLDDHCGFEFTALASKMLESDSSYQRPIDA